MSWPSRKGGNSKPARVSTESTSAEWVKTITHDSSFFHLDIHCSTYPSRVRSAIP